MKFGDWGLGIGDWGFGVGAHPPSPIPNPPIPIPRPKPPKFKNTSNNFLINKNIIIKYIKFNEKYFFYISNFPIF